METGISRGNLGGMRVETCENAAISHIFMEPICDTGHNIRACVRADLVTDNVLIYQGHDCWPPRLKWGLTLRGTNQPVQGHNLMTQLGLSGCTQKI